MKNLKKAARIFKCVCGFHTEDEGVKDSHIRIMDGVYGRQHYEVK